MRHLLRRGVPLDELRRATAEGRLVLLGVERALDASGERYAPRDVAERTGLDVEAIRRLRGSFGLAIPDAEERGLSDAYLEEALRARDALALGFTEQQVLRLNRTVGIAAAHMAEAMLQAAREAMLRPGEGEHELAHRLIPAAERLLSMAGSIASYAIQEHLRAQLSRTAITTAELHAGHPTDVHEVCVLFADLVGFTELGEAPARSASAMSPSASPPSPPRPPSPR